MPQKWKDVLIVAGFASIFNLMGCMFFVVFSSGSELECDRWTDSCVLTHEYLLAEDVAYQWALSEIDYVYLDTEYPRGTPEETKGKSPSHRAVIRLKNQERMPFTPERSNDKEGAQNVVDAIQAFVATDSLTAGDNGRLTQSVSMEGYLLFGGVVLNLTGIIILIWGLWPVSRKTDSEENVGSIEIF